MLIIIFNSFSELKSNHIGQVILLNVVDKIVTKTGKVIDKVDVNHTILRNKD